LKNLIHKTSLRTDMSLWLDIGDALIRRLEESDDSEGGDDVVRKVREGQLAISEYFAGQAQATPKRYKAYLGR
jgi:hypothetical protein